MKIWHTTALVVAVGLGLGFVATHGFAAHPKRAVYVVVEADEITDASRYEAMKKRGPANIVEAKFVNGRYLARTENVTSLDGTAPKGIVIIAFDNAAKAKAYVRYWPKADMTYVGQAALLAEAMLGIRFPGRVETA